MGNLNSVDEFLRGFKEENHVLWLVSRKGKELGGSLEVASWRQGYEDSDGKTKNAEENEE
ncbi:hypothetical protein GCM10027454_38800 [Algoriphagus aestuariicola]